MTRQAKKAALLRAKAAPKSAATPKAWTLREAKARFSEVVRLAQKSPQRVTSRGQDAVVVLSAAAYQKLQKAQRPKRSLVEFLKNTGFSELDLERRFEPPRDIEL